MPDRPAPPPLHQRAGGQAGLLASALQGLSLDDEPFARLGAPLGLGGDAVIEALRQLLGQGQITRIGPVFAGAARPAADALDHRLLAACGSGLPLVRQPYEALGAMLGLPAGVVQARLADWQRDGLLLRMAAVPADPER